MPDELEPQGEPDSPQLETPDVTTDNTAADSALDNAPPPSTEPSTDNVPAISPQEYEYLRRENAELRRYFEQRQIQPAAPAIQTPPASPQYEGELAWMKPIDETIDRRLSEKLKTVEQFIEEQKQIQFQERAERIAYKAEKDASSLVDWYASQKPALKNDPDLAKDLREEVIASVKQFCKDNPGRELAPQAVTQFMDREIQKALKAESRSQAKLAKLAAERAKGAGVPSVPAGSSKPGGAKQGPLDNDSLEAQQALIRKHLAQNKK